MRKLLIPLLVALSLPIAVNATSEFEEFRKICALTMAGQITAQDAADKLGIKEPKDRFFVGKKL